MQDNTQVSPPVVDQYEIGQTTIDQNPNVNVCGYYYLPGKHSGDVAQTIKDLQFVGVQAYRLDRAGHGARRAPVRQLRRQRRAGRSSPALTETMTLPAGTLYIPMSQQNKHWIPGRAGREPVPAVQLQLRRRHLVVLAAARFRRRRLPDPATVRTTRSCRESATRSWAPRRARRRPVYAFDTDSSAGLAMVNQLLGQGAIGVARGRRHSMPAACTSTPARRSWPARPYRCGTVAADAAHWQTPVYGLGELPGQPLRDDAAEDRDLHGRHDGADQPGHPRHRRRLLPLDRLLRGDVRPHAAGGHSGDRRSASSPRPTWPTARCSVAATPC